jgi:UDP-N-acetylglucosamine 1-carboxyvinyltransferase
LLSDDEVKLSNIPRLEDVLVMLELIRSVGADVKGENEVVTNTPEITNTIISEKAQSIRASILLAGPLVARAGAIRIPFPGGCDIGARKIDLHIKGLKTLGAKIKFKDNVICIESEDRPKGAKIDLPFPSVGATENLIMSATLAEGETIMTNCSIEPEVVDLELFLRELGAEIEGIGTNALKITGVEELKGARHTIIPDRIETGTYIAAAAITDGEVVLENCNTNIMKNVIEKFTEIGVEVKGGDKKIRVSMGGELSPTDIITQPYPGFPTDMHPIMAPLLSLAKGRSSIKETIYDNRFQYVQELKKMGANIEIKSDTLFIDGTDKLNGSRVVATDLRGGAAVVLAGLIAEGTTVIENIRQINRGYEQINKKLQNVDAKIK